MLYLAEVQKKSGLLGAAKAELRLLACQRGEDRWQTLANEQVIPIDKAGDYGHGMLVLADVGNNNQIQRIQDAIRPILAVFQNYSRSQDKLKEKDEEVENWRQSLTFQSQELSRRQMEMEAQLEEVQQIEEQMSNLEQQRQEAMTLREEAIRLREELNQKNQEVEAAWAQIRQEKAALESQQAESGGAGSLGPEKLQNLDQYVNRLLESLGATESVQGRAFQVLEEMQHQQNQLDQYWQQLETHRSRAQELQGTLGGWDEALRDRWREWRDRQGQLEAMRASVEGHQRELAAKQDHAQLLRNQIKSQDLLRQQITQLAGGVDPAVTAQVNYAALDAMTMEELEAKVNELKGDYDRIFNFVNDQEEELQLQKQAIDELKAKIAEASEYDRMTLETEMADEQDSYRILDESLIDQRKTLHERAGVFKEHQKVLARRRGQPMPDGESSVDVTPVINQLTKTIQRQTEQLEDLERQIGDLESQLQTTKSGVEAQMGEHSALREALEQEDANWLAQHREDAGLQGNVATYQALLHPLQETLNGINQGAAAQLREECDRLGQTRDYQRQLLEELRQHLYANS